MFTNINSSIEELVHEYICNEKNNSNELNLLLIKIKNEKENLDVFLKSNERFYMSTNDIFRKNSFKLISLIFERVKTLKFNELDFEKYLNLGIGKLKDVICAPFAVKTINHLLYDHLIYNQDKSNVIRQVINNLKIENFHIANYLQETRLYAIKIFLLFIDKFYKYLKESNCETDYIHVVLDGIENEKDPRNILQIFDLVKKINTMIDISLVKVYSKNFFEIIEVYYPIEFIPPKNSPDKITADDLINSLNDCFASNEFYLEYLIDIFRDKFSSMQIDTKIQVLKTIKKINETHSYNIMKEFFITLINLILQQILNNEDEFLHIEAIITYKELIEKVCNYLINIQTLTEQDSHIMSNLLIIFEKSEDLLFSSENNKNSIDAKDLIVVLIEYVNLPSLNFKDRASKICLKLINNYIETNQINFLKNANSILLFTLKNEIKFEDNMILMIRNLIFNLNKKTTHTCEEAECIVDITTCFIVKTNIFTNEETHELFNKIFNTWKECDNSIENHLGFCLNKIIEKFEILSNLDFLIEFIENKIKYFTNLNCKNTEISPGDVCKYLNLLRNYFQNKKSEKKIINFILNLFLNLFHSINSNFEVNSSLHTIMHKLVEIFLTIFEVSDVIKKEPELFLNFVEKLIGFNSHINEEIFNDVLSILNKIIESIQSLYIDNFSTNLIIRIENLVKENTLDKIFDIKTNIFLFYLKIMRIILKINSPTEESFYCKFLDFTVNLINKFNFVSDQQIYLIKLISKNFGIAMYNMCKHFPNSQYLIKNGWDIFMLFFESFLSKKNETENMIISINIINYVIIYNHPDIITILEKLLNSFSFLTDDKLKIILQSSNLFKCDKKLFIDEKSDSVYNILILLKKFYEREKILSLNFILNFYSRLESLVEENLESIFILCIEALEAKVNIKIASKLIKRILKNIDKDFTRKNPIGIKRLIEIFVQVIVISDDMITRIDLLTCLCKLKYFLINDMDGCITKYVLKKLKPILNDKKRLIRKYCGMCINIWSMNE